ncbi:MAG: ATP-binding cassette domain-containing protein [Rhodobacteraceae bacterium]|nr:ATP-binding cassette domain-containing protein [Paracoccaceae bacterium]
MKINEGQITGLIGPNGSEKSTLFGQILGQFNTQAVRSETGLQLSDVLLMSQETILPDMLTVSEAFDLLIALNTSHHSDKSNVIDTWSAVERDRYRLLENRRCGKCSTGEKKWLFLRFILSLNKKAYLLDEPTAGVDPEYRALIWQLLHEKTETNCSIVVSSHLLDEIGGNCENICLLKSKKIETYNNSSQLLSETGTRDLDQAFLKALSK